MGVYYNTVPISLEHFWGSHTETIIMIANGLGIIGVCCLALMIFFVPSCIADDEEWACGRYDGQPYKMRKGRRIGIALGMAGLSAIGLWLLTIVLAGVTMAGMVLLVIYRG